MCSIKKTLDIDFVAMDEGETVEANGENKKQKESTSNEVEGPATDQR